MNGFKKEKRGGICFYNCDNIEFMKTKPDNYYDLAIVDPPYGIERFKAKDGGNSKKITTFQKPKDLYRWILKTYAKDGFKILDTHGGSHTNAIACDMEDFELDIVEIDQKYFNDGLNAFDNHKRQLKLF